MPPTGVFSSWETLAMKSRRTSSTRRAWVRSSTSSRMCWEPSGATRTSRASVPSPIGPRGTCSSTSRMTWSRRTPRATSRSAACARSASRTSPSGAADGVCMTTASELSMTIAMLPSTASTSATPASEISSWCSGGRGSGRRSAPGVSRRSAGARPDRGSDRSAARRAASPDRAATDALASQPIRAPSATAGNATTNHSTRAEYAASAQVGATWEATERVIARRSPTVHL